MDVKQQLAVGRPVAVVSFHYLLMILNVEGASESIGIYSGGMSGNPLCVRLGFLVCFNGFFCVEMNWLALYYFVMKCLLKFSGNLRSFFQECVSPEEGMV